VAPAGISRGEALRWLQTFNLQKVMCLLFLGPAAGVLRLRLLATESSPEEAEEVNVEPGAWAFLRTDMLSHTFAAAKGEDPCYVLGCCLLAEHAPADGPGPPPPLRSPLGPAMQALEDALVPSADEEDEEDFDEERHQRADGLSSGARRLLRHLYQKGMGIAVCGAASRLPLGLTCETLWAALGAGKDCATEVPLLRWNWEALHDPDPREVRHGKLPCKHGAFMEDIDLFDNKMFGISAREAQTMAPEQRQTLEVGYAAMVDAGFTRATMQNTRTGVYAGATWNEWNALRPIDSKEQGVYGATSGMGPITANRLSYVLNFVGPSVALDTEGSSSLVAVCRGAGALAMRPPRRTSDQSLCLGISLLLAPVFLLPAVRAGLVSRKGRCCVFDATAAPASFWRPWPISPATRRGIAPVHQSPWASSPLPAPCSQPRWRRQRGPETGNSWSTRPGLRALTRWMWTRWNATGRRASCRTRPKLWRWRERCAEAEQRHRYCSLVRSRALRTSGRVRASPGWSGCC